MFIKFTSLRKGLKKRSVKDKIETLKNMK